MAAYERVLVEISDHIGTATLNRPDKANAFDPDMCEDLLAALRMLARADAVRVIVRMVPAAEAAQLGLFDRVVAPEALVPETQALAQRWAGMAPLAVRKAKAALYRSLDSTLEEMLDVEIADQEVLFATPEARQLIRNR